MSESDPAEPPSKGVGVVVLAAGQGTRMRSSRPKVLHPVAGRPMIEYALDVARSLQAAETVLVVSPGARQLRETVGDRATIVEQGQQLGTGHAVLQARQSLVQRVDRVLVLYADTPLVQLETARRLLEAVDQSPVAILTADLPDPRGYGRVVRAELDASVRAIVEEADADPATLELLEVNSGLMAFEAGWLWKRLPRVPTHENSGEQYLTDLVAMAISEGRPVAAVRADQPDEILGVNSQAQLAQANRLVWDRQTQRLMAAGVTVLDPATAYVEPGVEVAAGTIIHPNTHLKGATRIGSECEIGPNTTVIDSVIGDGSQVWASVVEGSELEPAVRVGPFTHLRPGCHVESQVQLGNFAEAKASRIGRGTQVHHFSYVGDADVGERVNIGAGTITCNFDGRDKHQTVVGDDAFIGSDSMLVAPLKVGARARTGAGAVVTRDVGDDQTVVGVPARPLPPRETAPERESAKDGE